LKHNAEMNLVRKVIDSGSFEGTLFRGIRGEYFIDPEIGKLWDYILNHWTEYGKVPAHDTVFEDFPKLTKDLVKANPVETSDFYAVIVLDSYARRGFTKELMETVGHLEQDTKAGFTLIRQLVAKYDVIRDGVEVLDLNNTARSRYDEYYRESVYGIPFGWSSIDEQTMGMHAGQLIGFVARGGSGKTFCLLYCALQAWQAGYKVLVIATEIPPIDMLKRVDALYLKCNYNYFKKQMLSTEDADRYNEFLFNGDKENNARFQMVHGEGMSPSEIETLVQHNKPDVVFIDGVYRLTSNAKYKSGEDWQKIRYLANELKDLAMRNKIPVVFNTQFSRNVGTAVGKSKKVEGGLEDIGYGDEFGKATDLMISIFRDEEDASRRRLTLKVIKGRETEDGKFWKVDFNFSRLSFEEVFLEADEYVSPPGWED
jgi:replicative DNA helicase